MIVIISAANAYRLNRQVFYKPNCLGVNKVDGAVFSNLYNVYWRKPGLKYYERKLSFSIFRTTL
jgi:hypothetical protein